jgi:dTDP-4-dehydrorhamnose 3,5-epimerase
MELANQVSNEFTAIKMNIEGALEFKSIVQTDARGEFVRHYSASMLAEFESVKIANANISRTKRRLTFRGMHFQIPPFAESKLVSCLSGRVLDVLIDLRPNSPSFLKSEGIELASDLNNLVFVPAGVANGYLTLDDDVLVHYYSTAKYSKAHERGFSYLDPLVSIVLPEIPMLVSDKDKSWSRLCISDLNVFRDSH